MRSLALIVTMAAAMSSMVHAQLNGTYTIGGSSPSYATIDAALTALSGGGVSGPVRFLIRSGTYTAPAGGYVLNTYTGMNATNTVTFKPDAGATVTIQGNTNAGTAIFDLNGGKYYIFDGSNVAGGTSKDMTLRQLQTTNNPTIWMRNDADFNVVKYCNLQGSGGSVTKTSSTTGIGIVFIGLSTATTGNDSNLVQDCVVGDPTGTYRNNVGVGVYGTSAKPNSGNKILRCDIINFGSAGQYGYGVDAYAEQAGTVVEGCEIHMTVPAPSSVNTLYGIYTDYSPGFPINSVFTANKIYKLTSLAANWTLYGIYHWVSTTSANTTISNNMISFSENGDHTMYGIYYQSSSGTTNFYNNSFYFGGTATGSRQAYMLYKSSSNTILNRNNIYYNTRTGGTGNNYCYYMSSTGGTWTSTHNLVLFNTAPNYYTGYWTTNRYTLAEFRTASGQEQNCVVGNPRYVDPVNGNLHIQTGISTQVEGKGFVLAAVPTDFDGNTRNAATPDIGADEGAFTAPLANDMSADRIITPNTNVTVIGNVAFTPTATFINAGSATQNNVTVRMRIIDATTNAVVYSDTKTIVSITGGNIDMVTFGQNGNGGGNTALPAGNYNVEISTQITGDQDVSNDVYTTPMVVKTALSGTYTINKTGAGPRNFTSFTSALSDLTTLGVVGPVIFEIAGGTYDASTESFPLRLVPVTGMSALNTVTFKPAAGANPIIQASSPVGSAIFMIEAGKYYIFDGSNTVGGTTKNLTIRQLETTYNPTIWLRNDADLNVIKHCNLQGSGGSVTKTSSSNGIGIVYIGLSTATTGNDSNSVVNCTVGDPNGVYRNNVGIGVYGTSGKPNSGNKILRCDIINFGSAGLYGYGVDAYAEQAGTVVDGCEIHMTVPAPSSVTTLYGIYTDYSPGFPLNSVFNGNKIYKLTSNATNWTLYGIYHWVSTATAITTITNNMISIGEPGDHTIYGIYYQSSSGTINFYNNSFSINGPSTGTRNTYALYKSAAATIVSNNNIFSSSRTGGSGSNYGIYISNQTGWSSNRNMFYVESAANAFTAYWGGTRATLADYTGISGQDAASVSGTVPYLDAANGNLHLDPVPVFPGESKGATVGITRDFDGETRDAIYPDMGADEGDFNGGGIRVVTPNGGEKYSVDYSLDVTYTLTRPLSVRIEFSTNGGATWMPRGTFSGVMGTNVATITTPSNITSEARIRIMSQKNPWEGDSSDANFELVHPEFTFVTPNGGDRLVPTDTLKLTWNAEFTPPAMRLELHLSTNGGSTWMPVDTNVYAVNLPAVNTYDWVIPNLPTSNGIMRIKVAGGTINDVSDAPFTITEQPSVAFTTPVGGEDLFVGDTHMIRWTTVNMQYIRLHYTTNGGGSWNDVVPNGQAIPADMKSFPWPVPNTPSNDVAVRITNVERPRFNDVTDPQMSILRSTVQVMSPNGGEKYEMNQPVTVVWTAQNTTDLRLDYSTDNGSTWNTVSTEIDGTAGSYTFTPIAIPTKSARVRLVNMDRTLVQDASDLSFEIMEGKGIRVYTPSEGDKFVRGTTTMITWDAPRITSVNILYSPTGTDPWQTVASNVLSSQGAFTWNVPMQLTTQGKIRLQEVGGPTIGESGFFSIVEQAQPMVRVIVPNGGETYTVGDQVTVRWTSTAVNLVTISYSEDGTSNWKTIKTNLPGYVGQWSWNTTGLNAATTYRVKVEGSGVFDLSDGPFSITKPQQPRITVLYPDGGENLTIDSTVQIRWTAQDVAGDVLIELSRDNGMQWSEISMASAESGLYAWKVTGPATAEAMIRVSKPGAANVTDKSNGVFEISDKVVEPIVVVSPNGGEQWHMRGNDTIRWTAPSSVTSVDIEYSMDGGNEWNSVMLDFPSAGTSPFYVWAIPVMSAPSQVALIRVKNHDDPAHSDISNEVFSILNPIAGVETPVAGGSGLRSLGNYPNPFAGTTELRWHQGVASDVEIRIYQQSGALVSRTVVGRREGGEQRYVVNGADLASGAYIYEIRAGQEVARGVMMLVR